MEALTSAQKAAIIISSIGTENASEVFKHFSDEEVEQITLEIARMNYYPMEVVDSVLNEFYELCLTQKVISEGGVEYARDILEKAFGPQTIALILSYARSDQASAILSELPKKTRIDVVERMAKMDRASPDVVKSIERTLEKKFDNLVTADTTEVGGIDYVAEVMNNVDRATEKYIFDELTLRDPKLADDIRSKMFVFEDIVTLDNMAIQAFIPEVDSKDLAVAIKGSTPEVAECIYANMSTRMRESVQTDVEYLHNVRMRDVEEAQQRIVSIIRRLEDEGTLVISKGNKEDEIIA